MYNKNIYTHPTPITARVEVVEKEEGLYSTYIFKDLDLENEYYMIIKYPNWNQGPINIGDIGYVTYYIIIAGVSKWYVNSGENIKEVYTPYNYTHLALVKFIKDNSNIIKKDKDNKLKIKII